MTWKIDAELVFPDFMDRSAYDAGVSVYDWFDNGAPELDEEYATESEARAAMGALKKHYRGKDVAGVSCRLTIVSA